MAVQASQQADGDSVDTTAGGEHEPSTPSMGNTPGSGANALTRAGLPNADPDGPDHERSDLQGMTFDDIPPAPPVGSVPAYPESTRQRNDVAAPTAPTASHDA